MVMVYWFPPLALLYSRETGQIFWVSGHFPENGNEGNGLKCCMLLYTDQLKTNFRLWLRSVDFPHFAGFPAFSWDRMEGMPSFWHADVSQPPSELIWFWSCSRFFPILVPSWLRETGHIWGFRALSGERIGVNINQGGGGGGGGGVGDQNLQWTNWSWTTIDYQPITISPVWRNASYPTSHPGSFAFIIWSTLCDRPTDVGGSFSTNTYFWCYHPRRVTQIWLASLLVFQKQWLTYVFVAQYGNTVKST